MRALASGSGTDGRWHVGDVDVNAQWVGTYVDRKYVRTELPTLDEEASRANQGVWGVPRARRRAGEAAVRVAEEVRPRISGPRGDGRKARLSGAIV